MTEKLLINPTFLIFKEDTKDLKLSDSLKGIGKKSLKNLPIFCKIDCKDNDFQIKNRENTITYQNLIDSFEKIAKEKILQHPILGTKIKLSIETSNCFISRKNFHKIAKNIGIGNLHTNISHMAIFICPIALLFSNNDMEMNDFWIYIGKKTAMLFVYEMNENALNEKEEKIKSFQKKIEFYKNIKKYSFSTYLSAINDWVEILESNIEDIENYLCVERNTKGINVYD